MENETPTYTPVGENLIIGVEHGYKAYEDKAKLNRFLQALSPYSYLFTEGSSNGCIPIALKIEKRKDRKERNFEFVALSKFKGRTHFLEDTDEDYVQLAEKYGMRPDMFNLCCFLRHINTAYARERSIKDMLISATRMMWWNKDLEKSSRSLDVNKTIKTFGDVALNMKDSLGKLLLLPESADNFFGKVRDTIMCPRAKELCDNLDGRKVIIVGRNHVLSLEQYLTDGKMSTTLQWRDYIKTNATEEIIDLVSTIEDYLFKPKQ